MYICVCNPLEEKGGGGEGEGGERKEKDKSQTRNVIFPLGSKGYKCEKCFFGTRVPCSGIRIVPKKHFSHLYPLDPKGNECQTRNVITCCQVSKETYNRG